MLISYLRRTNFFAFLRTFNKSLGGYKLKVALLTVFGFVGGLLEGVGVNALIPIFAFVTGGGQGQDFISRTLRESFAYFDVTFSLRYLLVFVTVLFILKTIIVVLSDFVSIKITTDYIEKTRKELFRLTLRARWPYLLRQKLGHLNTIVMANVEHCEVLLNNFTSFIIVSASLVMYVAVAVNISLSITAFTVAAGALFLLLVKPLLSKTRAISKEAEAINRATAHHINENIIGMKSVKAMNAEEPIVKTGESYFRDLKRYKIRSSIFKFIPASLMQPLSLIFIIIVFAFSYKATEFNIAVMAAVVYLIQRIFLYVQKLQRHVHLINDSYPYLKSILEYKEEAERESELESKGTPFEFKEAIRFEDVTFSYTSQPVLSGMSATIKHGEMVGIVGPSGSGKTTIADLLLRLFRPTSGVITIDGKDIESINLSEWRKNIGYVSQDIFLMNATIRDNIIFHDQAISEKKIKEAVVKANIYEFIQGLPDGFDTLVGERGVMLSTGQRQRIVIARILARDPSILVLDEATSALDNESEAQIQRVVDNLRGSLTVIIIAHRLTTVMNVDTILVLERGAIVEQGAPRELLDDKNSYFYSMHNLKN